jgi:prepilin-type N-terminal cleavage/methylation domain-containing protein
MKYPSTPCKRGFTLLETVIAIGVLAVLLTGFIIVFAPAAAGIKKSIGVQEADRLASTLETELVTLRTGDAEKTGFEKGFNRVLKSNSASDALLVYQYRVKLPPGPTPVPMPDVRSGKPGKDYAVQTMMRRKSDAQLSKDLEALEGGVYVVKCTQLVFTGGELKPGTVGKIVDPKNSGTAVSSADLYPEAVIAFSADFHALSGRSSAYFSSGAFDKAFAKLKNPVFTRNLAVRR